jgi:hypothetical protein
MKYLFVVLLGLVIGSAAAGVVLYFNPLSAPEASKPRADDRVLKYSLPDHVLGLALGEDAELLGHDSGSDALWEETIDRAAVLGLVLNGADDQPAAIASRLMAVSADTDLVLRGMLLNDYWLVTLPGEGTLFVRADSNAWPFVKETLVPVWYLDRPWQGPAEYWPTVGPGGDRAGITLGLSGALRGEGRAVERYELTGLDPARGSALATGELHLALAEQQVAAQ